MDDFFLYSSKVMDEFPIKNSFIFFGMLMITLDIHYEWENRKP